MKKHLLPVVLVLLLTSCLKDETQINTPLPEKTQTGKNTFGFLLNSSIWINYGQVCFLFNGGCRENLNGNYYKNDGGISIWADRVLRQNLSNKTSESIWINLSTNLRGTGTYRKENDDNIHVYYSITRVSNSQSQAKNYILPEQKPEFSVTITRIDTLNKILSGEFSGKLFYRNDSTNVLSSTDSLMIRDGRFDIRLM